MRTDLSTYIGALATRAIMYEVSASPKPGLVDRFDSGAHEDMDYFTFIDSCAMIGDDFRAMALAGEQFTGCDLSELFGEIRQIGIDTEKKMFQITEGVNTHKGVIFSIGIIAAAAAFLMTGEEVRQIDAEEICAIVPQMVGSLTHEFKNIHDKETLTHGEKLYLKYGIKGVRGEVESGFETVLLYGLPALRKSIVENDRNVTLVNTLLSLMGATEDSNILHRHNMEVLMDVQDQAKRALALGGLATEEGQAYIRRMGQSFDDQGISPGGSADLLAVTTFLAMLEGLEFKLSHCKKCIKNSSEYSLL